MTSREDILARLPFRQQNQIPSNVWRGSRHFDDLPAQFSDALRRSHGEPHRVRRKRDAGELLRILIETNGWERIIIDGDAPLRGEDIREAGQTLEILDLDAIDPKEGRRTLRSFCARADAGVSGALALLAETGTTVLSSGPRSSRLATLLPPVHIVLAAESQLIPDLFSWVRRLEENWQANVVLVSGPSKTGDIEQTLSVGVHGPGRLIVILYGQ